MDWVSRSAALCVGVTLGVTACLSAGQGACSPEEQEFLNAVEHFESRALQGTDHPWGVCATTFTTDAAAEQVIHHYETELRATGWDEVRTDDGARPTGEPGLVETTTVSAYRGTFQYHVEVSTTEDGPVRVDITAGDAQS